MTDFSKQPFSYRSDENNFPMQLCKGRRIMRTAIPARHDIPISIQSRTVTATACSGPAHRKCKKIVTFKEKDKAFLGLYKSNISENTAWNQQAPKEQWESYRKDHSGFKLKQKFTFLPQCWGNKGPAAGPELQVHVTHGTGRDLDLVYLTDELSTS
jgi:hypothetical protein